MTTATSIEPCMATVNRQALVGALRRAIASADRVSMSGLDKVFFDFSRGDLEVVGSDGREMAVESVPCERGPLMPSAGLLRDAACSLLSALEDCQDETIDIVRSPHYLGFQWGPECDRRPRWIANCFFEKWIKWRDVIPAHHCKATASVSAWRAAANAVFPGRGTDIVSTHIAISAGTIGLTTAQSTALPILANDASGEADVSIDLRRLRRWLLSIPARGTTIIAELGAPTKPIMLRASNGSTFVLAALRK